ncbi:MAG: hypothetical protein ACI4E2_07120 [Acetatifactor sp.]
MNHLDVEIAVCEKLLNKGIPVCRFISDKQGKKNCGKYLRQANMASGLLVWFENHIDELNDKLCELRDQRTPLTSNSFD